MMMPDCRNDDYYNEDFLSGDDHEFVRGFDWCAEEVVDNFFNNMNVFFDDDNHLLHVLNETLPEHLQAEEEIEWRFGDRGKEVRKIETYADFLRTKLEDWIESERDSLITSMIDNMDEDLFNAIRNKVLKENAESSEPKEYYDSRKYAVTGTKVADGPQEIEDDS